MTAGVIERPPVVDRRTVKTATLPTQRKKAPGPILGTSVRTEDPVVADCPISLSPAQFASLKQARAQINVWTGAIRSGKTISSLLRWVMYVRRAPLGGRLVMVGKTKDTLNRNIFSVLTDPAVFGPIAAEVKYTPGSNVATIFGRVVDVIGANDAGSESKLRGLTCAGAYVDEITLLPREFFTQLLGRMSIDSAKLFGTTNPDNPGHWLRRDFLLRADDPNLSLRHWHFTITDNPTLTKRKIAQYKAQFTGLFYKRFIEGRWIAAEGAIFDSWDEEKHILRGELPLIDRWLACGIDYGTKNPFAAVSLAMDVHKRLIVTSEYRWDSRTTHVQKSDEEYREALESWLAGHPIPGSARPDPYTGQLGALLHGINPEYVVVDPAALSFIVELQRRSELQPAGANNAVLDGIRTMATLLARGRLLVHESCAGLIAEFPGYSWDDREAVSGRDVPIKADDHSLDALRYAILTTEALWRPFVLEYA